MIAETMRGPFIAAKRLLVPNAPGKHPPLYRFDQGVVFSLDGDEQVNVEALLQVGAIRPYSGDMTKLEPMQVVE